MSNLETTDRATVWCDCMRMLEPTARADNITKAEYRTAVDTLDAWIGTTAIPSIAMLLPLNVRTALSTKEQVELAAAIMVKRVQKEVY